VHKLVSLPDKLGTAMEVIADNGFFSQDNVKTFIGHGITPYIAADREQHNQSPLERFREPPSLPDTADTVTRMKQQLKTVAGRGVPAIGKSTIEPVFGIIKTVMGFEAVQGEWNLVCMARNIKRLHVLAQ
jgi:hypothetical protein